MASAALKGEKTLTESAQQFDVHPNQITAWRAQLPEGAADVFAGEAHSAEPTVDLKVLHEKIGELTLAIDFWAGELGKAGKAMIDRSHPLPLTQQVRELGVSRGSVYYLLRQLAAADLTIMRRIDELHMDYPFAGSRMLRVLLAGEGIMVGRLHVATLMKKMAIEAIYRRPNTSKPAAGHKINPYVLRKLAVTRPNQVWPTDITHIPLARGFVYLVAIVDWFSRRVLSWRLSITPDADFCIQASEEALSRFGLYEVFNTDQGSRFTSYAFTGVLLREGIAISMDGKAGWRDNVFVERLWRSMRYEEVYLHVYGSVPEARASIGRFLVSTTSHPSRRSITCTQR